MLGIASRLSLLLISVLLENKLFTNKLYRYLVKIHEFEDDLICIYRQLDIIKQTQDALCEFDTMTRTVQHLASPSDDIVREVLAFVHNMLFNGNEKSQVKRKHDSVSLYRSSFYRMNPALNIIRWKICCD